MKKVSYLDHIKLNHYMWNYTRFIGYIKWKNPIDYSGVESCVAKKLQENDISWIPFNRAKELEDKNDNKDINSE